MPQFKKKVAEEVKFNRLGQPWHNCIKCREKRKEYKKNKIQEVVDHVPQLLVNDLILENYCMIGKHKDRAIIEIPLDDKPEQTTQFFLCYDIAVAFHKPLTV